MIYSCIITSGVPADTPWRINNKKMSKKNKKNKISKNGIKIEEGGGIKLLTSAETKKTFLMNPF